MARNRATRKAKVHYVSVGARLLAAAEGEARLKEVEEDIDTDTVMTSGEKDKLRARVRKERKYWARVRKYAEAERDLRRTAGLKLNNNGQPRELRPISNAFYMPALNGQAGPGHASQWAGARRGGARIRFAETGIGGRTGRRDGAVVTKGVWVEMVNRSKERGKGVR